MATHWSLGWRAWRDNVTWTWWYRLEKTFCTLLKFTAWTCPKCIPYHKDKFMKSIPARTNSKTYTVHIFCFMCQTSAALWACVLSKRMLKVWTHRSDVALVRWAPPADCWDVVARDSPLPHLLPVRATTGGPNSRSRWGMAGESHHRAAHRAAALLARGWRRMT